MAALAMALGSLTGCGDDGATDTSTSDSGETTSTPTGSTTAPATDTDPTNAATEGMTSDTTAGSEEGTATAGMTSDTTAGSEEGTTTMGMTSDTTAGGACEGLGEAECSADPGCMPISGAPIEMSGGGFCLQPLEFIECQVAIGCGDAITYACEGDDAQTFEFLDTCIPDGWVECPPPGNGALPPC